jgi:hypothetical protein
MAAALEIFDIFCSYGGPYIAPLYMPIFGLLNVFFLPMSLSLWCVLLLSIFTPIYTSSPGFLNSSDNTNKDGGKAFGYSFLIYYIVMIIIFCSIMQISCKAKEAIGI